MADGTMMSAPNAALEAKIADAWDWLGSEERDSILAADPRYCVISRAELDEFMRAAAVVGQARTTHLFDLTTGGRETIGDKTYLLDAKGRMVPIDSVKAADLLIDEMVRKTMGYALGVSRTVASFKQRTLNDFSALMELLEQDYKVTIGGKKGNVTLTSFDGTLKVSLQVADRLTFGPELQAAKKLVDEYLNEATAEGADDLRVMVQQAFSTDQEGKVNRAELFGLLRREFKDERLVRAMQAVRDSVRIEGTKEYVRFYRRDDAAAPWEAVTIDLAAA